MVDLSQFYTGFPDQAEDPNYPANYWQQKVEEAQARQRQGLLQKYFPQLFRDPTGAGPRRPVGNPGRMQAEMQRGDYSPYTDLNSGRPGLDGQADDRALVDRQLAEKIKAYTAPVLDSANNAWQSWLDFQQHGSLMDKVLDPGLNRRLGIFQEGKPALAQAPEGREAVPDTMLPPNSAPPSGPGGSPMALPPPNPYMEALAKMVMGMPGGAGVGGLPRVHGNYPTPPTNSINIPGYPDSPVPQRTMGPAADYSKADQYLEQGKPKEYQPNEGDMLAALLGGAAAGFGDWRPGDRLGAQLARAGGGSMQAYLGQKRYAEGRKEAADARLAQYYTQRGGIEEGRANQAEARGQRQADISYGNEQAQREDLFRKADYDLRTQQIQNELANGNWNRAFMLAQAMRADERGNAALSLQEKQLMMHGDQMKMQGLLGLARTQAYANKPTGGKTLTDLGPGAMTAKIIGDAVNKSMPIPGYDVAALQQQALAAAKGDKQLQQTFALNPQLQKSWVNQWVAAAISRDLASNPAKLQQIQSIFAKVPLGNYSQQPHNALGPDDSED